MIMTGKIYALSLPLIVALTVPAVAGTPSAAKVERIAPDKVMVSWTDQDAVDVYMADRPDTSLANATLVSRGDKDGRHEMAVRSEEHTSELQSLMRISYAVFCLKKKKKTNSTKE